MSENDYYLLCLAEEMAELSKDIFKTLRFGIEDFHPHTGVSNREALANETHDVRALLQICVDRGLLPARDFVAEEAKFTKVARYLQVSKDLGRVV